MHSARNIACWRHNLKIVIGHLTHSDIHGLKGVHIFGNTSISHGSMLF